MKKTIGFNIEQPKESCNDDSCPFHGSLKVRGRSFTATVVSTKMHKSATVAWDWRTYVPKYERYEKKRTKIHVHNPSCITVTKGDTVKIMECKPISKTKNFVIIEKIK